MQKDNYYIITGGPGAGKTSLINELQTKGFKCIREAAREIIRQQVQIKGRALPWADIKEYSKLMLDQSIIDYQTNIDLEETIFFDRGIPDTFGYEQLMNLPYNSHLDFALKDFRYNPAAFILPPWKEIYETDSERKQDFAIAVETFHIMCAAYKASGYILIELPCIPVEERADFILRHL